MSASLAAFCSSKQIFMLRQRNSYGHSRTKKLSPDNLSRTGIHADSESRGCENFGRPQTPGQLPIAPGQLPGGGNFPGRGGSIGGTTVRWTEGFYGPKGTPLRPWLGDDGHTLAEDREGDARRIDAWSPPHDNLGGLGGVVSAPRQQVKPGMQKKQKNTRWMLDHR